MDQLPEALEAATGPRPDDLDLPTLHHRARSRRTGRRAVLLTGALGLVAVTGLGLAAVTGGGGAKTQLTASEGGPDGTSAVPAADPCGPGSTTTTAPTTTESGGDPSAASSDAPSTTTTTVITPTTATGAAGPKMEATVPSGATTATTDPADLNATEQPDEPFVTTSTTDPSEPSTSDATETTETTTTTVDCAPVPSTTQVPGTTMLTPSTVTAPPSPSPTPSARVALLTGSFSGEGPVLDQNPQGCAQMHHSLNAAATVGGGSGWKLSERYCGVNDGTVWSGEGTFRLDDGAGNSFGGTFTSRAAVPTTGEPYELTITGGTGNHVGATGACTIDNHIEDTGPGRTRQFGTFTCDLGA